jgi:hypothetical protein
MLAPNKVKNPPWGGTFKHLLEEILRQSHNKILRKPKIFQITKSSKIAPDVFLILDNYFLVLSFC